MVHLTIILPNILILMIVICDKWIHQPRACLPDAHLNARWYLSDETIDFQFSQLLKKITTN